MPLLAPEPASPQGAMLRGMDAPACSRNPSPAQTDLDSHTHLEERQLSQPHPEQTQKRDRGIVIDIPSSPEILLLVQPFCFPASFSTPTAAEWGSCWEWGCSYWCGADDETTPPFPESRQGAGIPPTPLSLLALYTCEWSILFGYTAGTEENCSHQLKAGQKSHIAVWRCLLHKVLQKVSAFGGEPVRSRENTTWPRESTAS